MYSFLKSLSLFLLSTIFFFLLANNISAQYWACPEECSGNSCPVTCQGESYYCGESTEGECAFTCFGCSEGTCPNGCPNNYVCIAGQCVVDGDNLPTTCSSFSGWGACSGGYQTRWCTGGTGDWELVYQIQQCAGGGTGFCGDNLCNNNETCDTCPGDCGVCGGSDGVCGDFSCSSGENCNNCPTDCGDCGVVNFCGNGVCTGSETCSNCPSDCGSCGGGATCGDTSCNGFETCATCPSDCGSCPTNFAWWQVAGGHAYAGGNSGYGIQSIVPSNITCVEPSCTPAIFDLNLAGDTNSDGFPITGGGTIDSNGEAITYRSPDVSAVTGGVSRLRENYTFFTRQYSLGLSPTHNFPSSSSDALKPTYDADTGYYFHDGDMTIQTAWSVAETESYVVFVDGNLTVTDPGDAGQMINVADGGFLAFIVSGNIEFDQTVGTTTLTSTTPNVEGVYVADGLVIIETNTGLDEKFVAAGTIVGWSGFVMERDYNDQVENAEYPTELFIYRPDLVRNTPSKMKRSQILWQETN